MLIKPYYQSRREFCVSLVGGLSAISVSPLLVNAGINAESKPFIWDLHVHLSRFPGNTPMERMNSVMEYADRMGIDRVLLYLGMPPTVPDPSPDDLRRKNDETLEALRDWPKRALGLVYLNPKHEKFSLDEFDRCVRNGPMVGVKLWIARRCNGRELDPIVEQATELNALIYQHTWIKTSGPVQGESTPMDVAELARRHPKARLVCGHAGGNWELGIRAIRETKNVYLGIAGSEPTSGFTEMAVRELGAERVLYGSDVGGRSFASQLAKVLDANIPNQAKKLILGENLKRILTPIIKSEGS